MDTLKIFLLLIVVLIPIVGFIMTINHARAGLTARDQRWRKSHGVLFWVVLPGFLGALIVFGMIGIRPRIFSLVGTILLAVSTSLSLMIQKKRDSL